ncbi:MAG: ferritin-like domain-containing protein [Syntrophomonas sp.]
MPCKKNEFKEMVWEAIADEIGAVAMYATMANMVDDVELKTLILSIAGDEYGHAKFWLAVYNLDD